MSPVTCPGGPTTATTAPAVPSGASTPHGGLGRRTRPWPVGSLSIRLIAMSNQPRAAPLAADGFRHRRRWCLCRAGCASSERPLDVLLQLLGGAGRTAAWHTAAGGAPSPDKFRTRMTGRFPFRGFGAFRGSLSESRSEWCQNVIKSCEKREEPAKKAHSNSRGIRLPTLFDIAVTGQAAARVRGAETRRSISRGQAAAPGEPSRRTRPAVDRS